MQPEILRFLLVARAHLRDRYTAAAPDTRHADMQAIDRMLPDADWFERVEFDTISRRLAVDLWAGRVSSVSAKVSRSCHIE